MPGTRPFFRMGDPIAVPVSAGSAATPIEIALPTNVSSFMLYNPNPFFVRLRGTNQGGTFTAVTNSTGWPMEPYSMIGPFTTQRPTHVSVQAFALPNRPLTDDDGAAFSFAGTWVELIYGSGE